MSELSGGFKRATVWLLLGTAVFLAVQAWLAERDKPRFTIERGTLTLERGADGHYRWPGRIDGRAVEFLVDTGATRSAIPQALAGRLGLAVEGRVSSQTAGGLAEGQLVRADLELAGGVRAQGLRLLALPALHTPLLGMDILGRMRLQQDRGRLHIELQPGPASPR